MGLGSRVVNFIADTLIIYLVSLGLSKWYLFYVRFWDYTFMPFYAFFWATLFLYYFLFEVTICRTPGKFITFTIVRTATGKRPSIGRVLLRSLLRLTIVDAFFIPFFDRPLHDQLSGTRVVQAEGTKG